MKVILRQDTDGLGKKGDVLDVADGYGRNFLLPTGRALLASKGAIDQAQAMRRARDIKDALDKESAETAAGVLVAKPVVVEARAGAGGKLFGSVGATDIVGAVSAQTGVVIDRKRLSLDEPIRSIGLHEIPLKLHADVEITLVVEVTAASQ